MALRCPTKSFFVCQPFWFPRSIICAVGPELFMAWAVTMYWPSGDQSRRSTCVVPPHYVTHTLTALHSTCANHPHLPFLMLLFDSPAARLLSSVVQVEKVCDCGRVVPQVLHCKLRWMALTVEQMLYGVWCHSTLRTNIWYAAGNAGLVTVQEPTVTRTQLGKCGMDWPRQQTFKWWHIGRRT